MWRSEDEDLSRRLTWLLVFRALVATVLLALTLLAEYLELQSGHISVAGIASSGVIWPEAEVKKLKRNLT